MGVERELKFSLLDAPPAAAELRAALRGSPFALVFEGVERLQDHYFDDDVRSLRGAGLALRRRRIGATLVATLKSQGHVRGALFERDELEGVMEGGQWPEMVTGRLTALLRGGVAALRPVLELDIERLAYTVHSGGRPVARLTFDEVAAREPGGERDALFGEAELEARGDEPASTLQAVAERLASALTLTPSGVSKLERSEALLLLGATL